MDEKKELKPLFNTTASLPDGRWPVLYIRNTIKTIDLSFGVDLHGRLHKQFDVPSANRPDRELHPVIYDIAERTR